MQLGKNIRCLVVGGGNNTYKDKPASDQPMLNLCANTTIVVKQRSQVQVQEPMLPIARTGCDHSESIIEVPPHSSRIANTSQKGYQKKMHTKWPRARGFDVWNEGRGH